MNDEPTLSKKFNCFIDGIGFSLAKDNYLPVTAVYNYYFKILWALTGVSNL